LNNDDRSRDSGFSLPEMLVTMAVFGLLMSFTFGILISIMYQSRDTQSRALALEDMRLGLSQIDRQVRSGNVILDPEEEGIATSGVEPFYSMRIFTQEGGEARCAQWRVIDKDGDGYGNLEFRTWDPIYPASADVDPWGVVAHNIIDVGVHPTSSADIDPTKPATWPPFWTDKTIGSRTEAQFVRITLRLRAPGEIGDMAASVTTVVTGRNTVFGYPSSTCSVVPPP
jgi:prepilin-type N-terminal cleavage/methylation domain-containing protein